MKSNTESRIEAAWPAIHASVTDGLKELDDPELTALVAMPTRPADLTAHVHLTWTDPTGNDPLVERALHATPDRVVELVDSTTLPLKSLDPKIGSTTDLTDWARRTREHERRWVLNQIARLATAITTLDPSSLAGLPAGTRLVVFVAIPNLSEHCDQYGVELIDAAAVFTDRPDNMALAYPSDRFAVSRLEPFSPGWDVDGDELVVTLTERVELIGFDGPTPPDVRSFTHVGTFPPLAAAPP